MRATIFIAVLLVAAVPCQGRVITVDDDGPADFNNIQAAIDDAEAGETVIVADGIYTGEGNRDIDFLGKAITVRSTDPNDPTVVAATVVDCNGTPDERHRGFWFHSGEDWNSMLDGLTITNGYSDYNMLDYGLGGGIYCYGSSPVISRCIIKSNRAPEMGAGIGIYFGSPIIMNNLIIGNKAWAGGGVAAYGIGSEPEITNCTISGNFAEWGGSAILSNCGANILVRGSIVWSNLGDNLIGESIRAGYAACKSQPYVTVDYSILQSTYPGTGNIVGDPCFIRPGYWANANDTNIPVEPNEPNAVWVDGDYHLQSAAGRWDPNSESWVTDANTSVAIDAGDPNSDWTEELWPHGKRINAGAYGGTAEASMSLSAVGNIANLDNDFNDIVDGVDLGMFVDKWLYEEILLAEDLDRDNDVDFDDFDILGGYWGQ